MNNLIQIIFTIFCCLIIANIAVKAVVITDCSEGSRPDAKLGTVSIDGCSQNDDACPLIRGKNATIRVDFESVKTFREAKLNVAGKIGTWLPFSIKPDDACGNYGFNCPVNENEKKQMRISLPISKLYPQITLDIRVKLLDENKNLIICFILPAKIQNGENIRRPRVN